MYKPIQSLLSAPSVLVQVPVIEAPIVTAPKSIAKVTWFALVDAATVIENVTKFKRDNFYNFFTESVLPRLIKRVEKHRNVRSDIHNRELQTTKIVSCLLC